MSSHKDMTDRNRAEEALRRSEELYRTLTENMKDVVYTTDCQGVITFLSSSVHEVFGFTAEEMTGQRFTTFLSEEDIPRAMGEFQKVFETGLEGSILQLSMKRKDGRFFIGELRSSLIWRDGQMAGTQGMIRDVTEHRAAEEELKKSQNLLSNLARLVPGVIYQYRLYPDGHSAFPWSSPGMNDIYEVTPDEVREDATPVFGRLHPEDAEFVSEAIFESSRTLDTFYCEFRVILPRQGLRWRWSQAQPERTEDGGTLWHGIISDITERKLGELALQASEERNRTILRTAMDGFWRADTKGQLKEVNEGYCQMTGFSEQELLSMSIFDLDVNEDCQDTATFIKNIIEKGEDRFESRHNRKDGSIFDVEISAKYLSEEGGYFVAFVQDISERRKAINALADERNLLELITINSPMGIVVVNPSGAITFANPFAERILGLSLSDLKDRTYDSPDWDHTTLAGDPFPDEEQSFVQVMKSGGPVIGIEQAIVKPDGPRVMLSISAAPLKDSSGAITGVVAVLDDITEHKKMTEEKEKYESQLHQAQKMESVGRLAGGVAHDFNNMLMVILGNAEFALDLVDKNNPLAENLKEIRNAAQRSAKLTQQLLAYARKQTIAPRSIDLNEVLESMLTMLRRLIGENIKLTWRPGKLLWPVKVDPSQIDQVLVNLCVNARDAITGVGNITIATKSTTLDASFCEEHNGFVPGDYVLLNVSDNGCGMDASTQEKLFEPFFTTKPTGVGTGLGLAMVYGAVKQNEGFIDVYSEPGEGTIFNIYLPRFIDEAGKAAKEGAVEPLLRGTETILLVEDEISVLRLTKSILENLGYKVLAENAPDVALQLAKTYPGEIKLLITDVVMPKMNGRDLADKLIKQYPKLKCLFMSGYTADIIAHNGVLDDGMYFIQKPFSSGVLASTIREALDS
ncbi:PAS domain S-box protein [bacterium]|nr:PAS domain S-box protein [bacterium]